MPTILCIDDDQQCLFLRAEVLRRAGFNILTATDGPVGIALAKRHKIDAVVLDYAMPIMDGEEVAQILKQDFAHLPIILCSGCDEIPEGLFKLVDSFVTKGDGVEFLISAIREVTTHKRKSRKKSA